MTPVLIAGLTLQVCAALARIASGPNAAGNRVDPYLPGDLLRDPLCSVDVAHSLGVGNTREGTWHGRVSSQPTLRIWADGWKALSVDAASAKWSSLEPLDDDGIHVLSSCKRPESRDLTPTLQHHRPAQDSVWAAVLDSLYDRTGQPRLLIADRTMAPSRFGPGDTTGLDVFSNLVRELDPALILDFRDRNRLSASVNPTRLEESGLRMPVAPLSRAEFEDADVDPNTGLYKFDHHPGSDAVIRLSQVGFSPDGQRALVHVTFSCGPRCGSTRLVLLTRERHNGWRVSQVEEGITF